ncbi:hypothetical protein PVAP13_9NG064677 [Panicum virgatum]|uniref:Uncharacterized protein n=1 Tax=Panicum virgatum TaxID=38727 RepID=A0A8T0MDX7_PANVG|nr:hypothetical protein PVAP13_9NG064677 [Panicum virgatum]
MCRGPLVRPFAVVLWSICPVGILGTDCSTFSGLEAPQIVAEE